MTGTYLRKAIKYGYSSIFQPADAESHCSVECMQQGTVGEMALLIRIEVNM